MECLCLRAHLKYSAKSFQFFSHIEIKKILFVFLLWCGIGWFLSNCGWDACMLGRVDWMIWLLFLGITFILAIRACSIHFTSWSIKASTSFECLNISIFSNSYQKTFYILFLFVCLFILIDCSTRQRASNSQLDNNGASSYTRYRKTKDSST